MCIKLLIKMYHILNTVCCQKDFAEEGGKRCNVIAISFEFYKKRGAKRESPSYNMQFQQIFSEAKMFMPKLQSCFHVIHFNFTMGFVLIIQSKIESPTATEPLLGKRKNNTNLTAYQ